MEIRQLIYFVAAVEEKTVTAAAEKLHMTQPPLTMQLHALEEELGCKLFRREGRTLCLTDAGQHMYRRATGILALCDDARREMSDYRLGTAGVLRIGVISSVQGTLFSDWIEAYHRKVPGVRLSVFSANTYQLLERLRTREIDMAITRTPFSATGLDVSYLHREQISAVGKAAFFSGTPEALSLKDLAGVPLIIYRRWQKLIETAFESAGITPDVCCVNDDAGMTLQLARRGLGVSLLHASALPSASESELRMFPLAEPALSSEIALVCPDRRALPEPAVLFWRLVLELEQGAGNPAKESE